MAKGRIPAPGFFSDPLIRKAYTGAEWNGPAQGLLNPVQEVTAAEKRVQNGFSTRDREAMEMNGSDFYRNAAQLKREEKNVKGGKRKWRKRQRRRQNRRINTFGTSSASGDNPPELILYGDIASETWWGDEVTPRQFTEELDALGAVPEIVVRINSGGGDVFAANAIYTRLKDNTAKITVKIDGWAASAATIIAMAGDSIEIPGNGVFMVHDPALGLLGYFNETELAKMTDELKVIKQSIVNAILKRERTRRTLPQSWRLKRGTTANRPLTRVSATNSCLRTRKRPWKMRQKSL